MENYRHQTAKPVSAPACVQKSPLPIFYSGRGDVCTQATNSFVFAFVTQPTESENGVILDRVTNLRVGLACDTRQKCLSSTVLCV